MTRLLAALRRFWLAGPVAALPPASPPQPCFSYHWAGQLRCARCRHTSPAIVEIATWQDRPIVPLPCPKCGALAASPD
jgi:hypothetical protein